MKWTALLAGAVFAALTVTAGITTTAPAAAQRWEDCRDRINHAERHLDRMIDRYGRHSREAREARHDLERTRDWCRDHGRRDRDRYDRHDRHDRRDGWGR